MKSITNRFTLLFVLSLVAVSFPLISLADDNSTTNIVSEVQSRWAKLNYNGPDQDAKQRLAQLDQLAEETEMLVLDHPHSAEIRIWSGIVLSTLAKAKGGLGALSMVKIAKLRFERALEIDPEVLNGSAYASLGTLYHKVPSWPVGFGSKKKAKKYFEKALAINPQGLDINFFYADYLADNKQKALAIKHLKQALTSPALINRPLADAGRRAQAKQLLAKLSS